MVIETESKEQPKVYKKLVIVGDGGCGKTFLLLAFAKNRVPENYVPTVFETYTKTISVEQHTVVLSLFDTAGQDAYDRLRPLMYPDTDILLVCFAADSPDSYYNAHDKWIPEVKHFCPNTPLIIVCTKVDLRNDENTIKRLAKIKQVPITTAEGIRMAKFAKAASYMECSAKTFVNVSEVFHEAVQVSYRSLKNKKMRKKISHCAYI
ncbi:ras-like GTP-binding protein Rho1 [Hydra vulgaris]|uniref:Ras-like GTP-binding protein Rho1 n=1 Tax=Hydra vulgaris TaxID=6087 RepID=A0ABM4CK05_HYDVU